jgi:hypothetical protein
MYDVGGGKQMEARTPINHVYCCDISGSMTSSLPKMREQLKNKLASIVHEGDTVSIIAFADGSDCYMLKKLAKLDNLNDLKQLQDAIDKYLRPECCTDFRLPVNMTRELINEAKTNSAWNWIFLSDGYHNCGSFQEVIDNLNSIKSKISSCTVIEYGYYADSKTLTKMATLLSGTKIPAKDFDSYIPVIEGSFTGNVSSKKIVADVKDTLDDLKVKVFFYLHNGVNVVEPDANGCIYVPSSVSNVYSISTKIIGVKDEGTIGDDVLYMAAYAMADLLEYEVVKDILVTLRDGKFIELYNDAYGKQKLFDFQTEVRKAIYNKGSRGKKLTAKEIQGIKSKYCVMDLINDLTSDDANKVCVASPDFQYNRIGSKQVTKVELSDEDKAKLANCDSTRDLAEAKAKIEAEKSVKVNQIDKGYPITDLVWNEDRANLSIQSTIDVELELPKNNVKLSKVKSKIIRNYTIIKDGILNVTELPLILSSSTYAKLSENELLVFKKDKKLSDGTHKVLLDFSKLPIINTAKVRACKMSTLTKNALKLNDYKFELKYLGYLKKEIGATDSITSEGKFTVDQMQYLNDLGVKNGIYSPKTLAEKSGDFYMALTLNSDFNGIKSIPKIEDVEKKLKSGKALTQGEAYMNAVMNYIDTKYLSKKKGEDYKNAVKTAFDSITLKKREIQEKVAQTKTASLLVRFSPVREPTYGRYYEQHRVRKAKSSSLHSNSKT